MSPGFIRLSRVPRMAAEVESIHLSSPEGLALHQGCSYKWSQWRSSLTRPLPCGTHEKQPNHLSASCHLEVSDYPPDFQKENHILITKKMISWACNMRELCHTVCKTWSTEQQENEEVVMKQPQRKGSKHVGYQYTQVAFIFTPHTIKGLSIFLCDWRIMLLTYNWTYLI